MCQCLATNVSKAGIYLHSNEFLRECEASARLRRQILRKSREEARVVLGIGRYELGEVLAGDRLRAYFLGELLGLLVAAAAAAGPDQDVAHRDRPGYGESFRLLEFNLGSETGGWGLASETWRSC